MGFQVRVEVCQAGDEGRVFHITGSASVRTQKHYTSSLPDSVGQMLSHHLGQNSQTTDLGIGNLMPLLPRHRSLWADTLWARKTAPMLPFGWSLSGCLWVALSWPSGPWVLAAPGLASCVLKSVTQIRSPRWGQD